MRNPPHVFKSAVKTSLFLLTALVLFSGFAEAKTSNNAAGDDFTFIVTSDVHYGAFAQSRMWLEKMIAEANAMNPLPAFILNCGDETERGWESEWSGYQSVIRQAKMPVYNTPGNHDVKWADIGKQRFRNYNDGRTYFSFDYGSYHFVSLDVSVTLQQYAHVEKEVLRWLKNDLKAVGSDRPVILFMHHPMGRWKFYVDNQYEVLKELSRFKVKLMFQGHEHNEEIWNENGITQINVNNLYGNLRRGGWYRIVTVKDGVFTIYNKRPNEAPIVSRAVLNMAPENDSNSVEITREPEPETAAGTQYKFEAQVHDDDFTPAYIGAQITDDGVFWNGVDGFYQFSLKSARRGKSSLKVRINRNSDLLAVALQAQRPDGTWGTVDWTSKSHDDNCDERCTPIDNQFWSDLKFRIPREMPGPFRLVSYLPAASGIGAVATPEINAFYIWLIDANGSLLDKIDVGNAQSESEHFVSVAGETGRRSLTSLYPTGVRYWLDITYLGGGRKSMVSEGQDVWSATFDTASQKPGRHTVKIQLFDDTGRAYTDFAEFTITGGLFEIRAALPTGGGIQSSPSVAEGKVFVGSNDGKVYAFNPISQAAVWTFQTGDQVISSPTIVGGVVYIGSADSKVYALDSSSGSKIWEFTTGGPIFGAPEVVEGVAYVGSGDHTLYAIDAASGAEKWRFSLPEDPGDPNSSSALIQMKPTCSDGVVYFGAWDTYVYAVKDGRQVWRTKIPRPFYYAPAYQSPKIIGDNVVVSGPAGVHYLLDKSRGTFVGPPFPRPSSFGYNDILVEGPSFYSISFGGTLAKFDLSGPAPTELWRTFVGLQVVNSGLVWSNSQLLAGGFQDRGQGAIHGNLISINPATRAAAFYSIAPQGWIFSRVGVSDGLAYLGALDGNLYVIGSAADIP